MKASAELHQLIKHMTGPEKRYFKIHSEHHVIGERNNYLDLFDAIERQDEYAEDEIKKQFHNKTFIKHLPSEKHYLYNHVLESLNAFNKDRTFLSRYSNILISIEILYNRGLFAQCKKLIVKAKREAYSLEKFSVLLIILRWETLVFIKDEDDINLNKNIQEELRVLEMMRIQYALMQIAFNVQIQIDKGNLTNEIIAKSEKEIKQNLPVSENVNSFWAKYYYHSTLGLTAAVRKKQMLRYQCFKEIKRLMDTAPQFIVDLPGIYHLNSNNLVNMMFLLKKYNEAEVLIRQQRSFMQNYKIKREALSKIVFLNTYESELYLHYKTKHYSKGISLLQQIEPEVKKIDVNFSPLLFDLHYLMAVTEFMGNNFKSATKWLNKILNAERMTNFRPELQINTRLLYLIVLFESNDRLFENRLNATKRFLIQHPQFKTQIKILEVIKLIADGNTSKKSIVHLKHAVTEIREEIKRTTEESLNKQFDFAEWIEAKLKGFQ